jgi:hypothetical protein
MATATASRVCAAVPVTGRVADCPAARSGPGPPGSETVTVVALSVGEGVALSVGEGVALSVGDDGVGAGGVVPLTAGDGTALAVGDGAGGGGVDPPAPPLPLTVAVNEVMARPVPPTHGSNPAWMLVRYHELVTLLRVLVSLTKSRTLKFQVVIGDGAT